MKLKYQTGIAAFVQFIVATVLGFANQLYNSISECLSHNNACVSNTLVSLVIIILIALWFGAIAILGYAAQDRRSQRLARILMIAEAGIALIALFDALHFPNILSLITSLIDFVVALWIISLAFRLSRAKGGRVMVSANVRKRQRRHTIS